MRIINSSLWKLTGVGWLEGGFLSLPLKDDSRYGGNRLDAGGIKGEIRKS